MATKILKSEFNIFSTLFEEIDDFNSNSIVIANSEGPGEIRFLKGKQGGYIFSQRQVLNLIDLYYNSKFERGQYDSEGQRKLFLNIGQFRADVAAKQTSLKIADFVFIPDRFGDIKKTQFMSRKFKIWARENDYGETIDEFNDDYSKYGTVVAKRVGKKLIRVPIRSIINSQDAKTLKEAAENGGYVIFEHNLTKAQMKKYKGWDLDKMVFDKKTGKAKVYERYGLAPETFTDESGDEENMVLTMAILAPSVKDGKLQKTGKIVFSEQLDPSDWPIEECHWKKQDGRWLGIGEIENQFENQIAKNFTANMRRRSILWGVKKVLQSKGDVVAKNLVKDVKDGEVLEVGPNGEISRVDLSNTAISDMKIDNDIWEENSNQKGFTYDVVTGNTPGDTPFRLGVLLSNAASSHFDRKRRKFGRFLERIFYNQLIEVFKKDTKEHTLQIANNSEGIEELRDMMVEYLTGQYVINKLLHEGVLIPKEQAQIKVEQVIDKSPYLFYDIPDGYYDDAKFSMQLETAGNSENVQKQIESATNLVTIALKNPDALNHPIIRRLLAWIMARTGQSLENVIGNIKAQVPAIQQPGQVVQQQNNNPAAVVPANPAVVQ